ncbi:hypothetical protein [Mucilaginibacter sp. HD30]
MKKTYSTVIALFAALHFPIPNGSTELAKYPKFANADDQHQRLYFCTCDIIDLMLVYYI